MKSVLVLGGAGFIGSNLVESLLCNGYKVIVIDGLLENTGGSNKNLNMLMDKITFIDSKIEEVYELKKYIDNADIIIDCMGWTSHNNATEDPFYDNTLNCLSHLYLIKKMKEMHQKRIIYLSSSSVYGKSFSSNVTETAITNPVDIHGIHKLTSEYYFKIYSQEYGFNVIILRVPNCYGRNQKIRGNDIGLIGTFINNALNDKPIEIYGKNRKRVIVYIKDLVNAVQKLLLLELKGFTIFNIKSHEITIDRLANEIIEITGKGRIIQSDTPVHFTNRDIQIFNYNDDKLKSLIGNYVTFSLRDSLEETITYFKERL